MSRLGAVDTAGRLRAGLLALAALGVVGTTAELAAIRHWDSAEQLIPWIVLAAMGAVVVWLGVRPSRRGVLAGRAVGLASAAAGLYGVVDHVSANVNSGPLDATYGPRWASMGLLSRWWAAASGGVGPAPVLAPAVLAQVGLCLALATVGHPARHRRSMRSP